jgi:signal transduction histidine kinase
MSRADRQDLALAAIIVAFGLLDVLAPGLFSTNIVGPRWLVGTAYVVNGSVLFWRRRRPGIAIGVVGFVDVAMALSVGASEGNGTLFPALVASYSVAIYGTRRVAIAGLLSLPVIVVVRELLNPQNNDWTDIVNALGWDLLLPAAWLLGAYLRTRRQLVHELRARARSAEREREERARTAVAEERSRIARELHDVVAHSVSLMVVQAEAAEEVLHDSPQLAEAPLRAIQQVGRSTLGELRHLLGLLREEDAAHAPQPGIADLGSLLAGFRASGLDVLVETRGPVTSLGTGVDLAAYRIVQEALTNVLKHAVVSQATLCLDFAPDVLSIEVTDCGRGPSSAASGGHGLLGMAERVKLYRGEFEAGPASGGGFRVRASLPREAGAS